MRTKFLNYYTLGILSAMILCGARVTLGQPASNDGFRREYYENGKLFSETDCLQKDSSGVYYEYYENGKIKTEIHYEAGQLQGPYTDYCEDGSPRVQFEYKNNQRDGIYKAYYENGKLQAEGRYKSGKEEGIHTVFYPNGNVAAEVNFIDGKETGLAKTYYQEGSKWEEFSYKNGIRDGEYREYGLNGLLMKDAEYKDGQLINANNYDEEQKLIVRTLNELILKRPAGQNLKGPVVLRKCVSDEIGVTFACDPSWKLNRQGKLLKIMISEIPRIQMDIEESEQTIHFMSEINEQAFASMGRYEEGFHFEHLTHCNREMIKINGYLKGNPQARVSDFYLIDHLHLHAVKFTVDPKEVWESYKWLIKEIVDSFSFTKQNTGIKFNTEAADESCEDLIK